LEPNKGLKKKEENKQGGEGRKGTNQPEPQQVVKKGNNVTDVKGKPNHTSISITMSRAHQSSP
jgi:hypothetical protein